MSAERPVLIVDDDDALRETLVDQLAVDGEFAATEAGSVKAAEERLAAKDARFDAVILDVGLPDGDGRDLCAKLRKQGQRMPIIMLTGYDSETDVVKGLDCGANDYIAKPFKLTVLLARLRAQLRIFENSEDAVFTIGETLRAQLEPRARQAVTITPNGADTDAFAPTLPDAAWQQRWNPGGGPLISYIGSFQPYEGLDVLIRALPAIVARIADVRVLIVGDGPERANLQRLADTLGVAPQVRFVGRVPHAQVREIYAVADLLVYPRLDTLTTRLTTPLKPLEALAMEKAVLASDLAAMRELVTHGETGCLFEPGNPAALARAAVELLQDAPRRLRLGKQGRLVTVAERTWQQSVAQYLPVYQKLLA